MGHTSRSFVRLALALALAVGLGLTACEPAPDDADTELASFLGAYALVTAPAGFGFYPPLSPDPTPAAPFRSDLLDRLAVHLERSAGGSWVSVATFDRSSSPALWLLAPHEIYMVNVPAAEHFTDPGSSYRYRVTFGGADLATADVPAQIFTVLQHVPAVRMGVKFRIEQRAVDRDGDGIFDGDDHCPDLANASNPVPQPEVCDGIDNDCDGQIDEGNPGGGASCSTGLLGSWVNASSGTASSEASPRAVLANVTILRIRGEFSGTLDTGCLDDVVLTRGP